MGADTRRRRHGRGREGRDEASEADDASRSEASEAREAEPGPGLATGRLEVPAESAPRCEVCGDAIPDSARVDCQDCGTPHHEDCFAYLGQCSVYGCGSRRKRRHLAGGSKAEPEILIVKESSHDRRSARRPSRVDATPQPLRDWSPAGGEIAQPGESQDTWNRVAIYLKRLLLFCVGMLSMAGACGSAVATPGQAILALLFGLALLIGSLVAPDWLIQRMR